MIEKTGVFSVVGRPNVCLLYTSGKETQPHIGENGKKGRKEIFFHSGFTSLRYMRGTGKNSTFGA